MSQSQIIFLIVLVATLGFFAYTSWKILRVLKAAKPIDRFDNIGERLRITLLVAFGQSKILRKPIAGILHALVWWGFLVITIGTVEMIIDGLAGTDRSLAVLGPVYNFITASGEVFAFIIILSVILFLARRYIIKPRRFKAPEMKPMSKIDATVILFLIFFLMVSLILMNTGYLLSNSDYVGLFPVSKILALPFSSMSPDSLHTLESVNWWIHIVLVLVFLNILPYSKHFHVIMAVPNVFFSRLTPKAHLDSMESVTNEVKMMMNPDTAFAPPPEGAPAELPSFGIRDVNQVNWKNIMDSYTCTECGRCTEVCPANNTGKKLSPRKLYIDLRKRATEVSPSFIAGMVENGSGTVSLVPDYISEEELWACTTCMACVQECPVDIDHVPFIVEMRRNLVLEQSAVPSDLTGMFNNMENNGAPWAFSAEDRMKWAEGLSVPTITENSTPEVLFWVGCAGAFDDRVQSITRAFASILKKAKVDFAVLGKEESCTGDPAKRAGNEFLYQMQAMQNVEILNMHNVKKIVTTCPHCFNILKNEYPDLGGDYEVMHHTTFLNRLIEEGKINPNETFSESAITYHDSCYLGRGNDIYDDPRNVVKSLKSEIREMKQNRSKGMCCGAGGAQMFKEEEDGKMRVNHLRTTHAVETGAEIVAAACPFCMTMMTDGVKTKESNIKVYDIAELIDKST
ncbi:MAG: 4Fe-4S dicluster domain-containing protein [Chitinophagales bacterium]|nr:4Fe-4S dicluster domain-containing protein [Chitinophagales bacterium]